MPPETSGRQHRARTTEKPTAKPDVRPAARTNHRGAIRSLPTIASLDKPVGPDERATWAPNGAGQKRG